MHQHVAHDDVADLLELDAGADQFLAAQRFGFGKLAAGHLGEIELDRRVLAVDAVVERRQRLDLVVVGRLVELHDALQHDLDRLADAHHLARRVGERLGRRVERGLGERGDFGRCEIVFASRARSICVEPLGEPVDEAGERHAEQHQREVEGDMGVDELVGDVGAEQAERRRKQDDRGEQRSARRRRA